MKNAFFSLLQIGMRDDTVTVRFVRYLTDPQLLHSGLLSDGLEIGIIQFVGSLLLL